MVTRYIEEVEHRERVRRVGEKGGRVKREVEE